MRLPLLLALVCPLASAASSPLDPALAPALDTASEAQGLLRVRQAGDAALPGGDAAAGMPDGRLAVASEGVVRVYGAGLEWEAALPLHGPVTKVAASRASLAVDVPSTFEQRWAVFTPGGALLYVAGTPGESPVEFRTFAADETGFWVVHQAFEGGPRRDSLQYRAPDGGLRWELPVTPTQYIFGVQPLGAGRAGLAVYTNSTGGMDLRVVGAGGALEAVFPLADDGTAPTALPTLAVDRGGDLLAAVARGDGEVAVARLTAGLQMHRGSYHTLGRLTVPGSVAGAADGGIAVFATSAGASPAATVPEPVMLRFGPCVPTCPLVWSRTLLDLTQGYALAGSSAGGALRFAFTRQCLPLGGAPSCDLAPREVHLASFEES